MESVISGCARVQFILLHMDGKRTLSHRASNPVLSKRPGYAPRHGTALVINARTWLAWLLLLTCETICQISLKTAGMATGPFDFSPTAFVLALSTPWLWAAIACYVGAFLSWLTILRRSTLSAAFATSGIVFVAVMCSSWLVFGERVGTLQLVGSSIILIGIFMIGTDKSADTAHSVAPSTARPGSR